MTTINFLEAQQDAQNKRIVAQLENLVTVVKNAASNTEQILIMNTVLGGLINLVESQGKLLQVQRDRISKLEAKIR